MSLSHLYGKSDPSAATLRDDDDDVEMERFEITDWDLQNEFNPNRQRHRQTKEEATYGIWAQRRDDSDDDERPSFGGKRSRDYSAPVNFISAGLKKPAASTSEKMADSEEDSEDEDGKPPKTEDTPKPFVPKKLKTGANFKPSQKGFGASAVGGIGGTKNFLDFGSWERHTKGIGQKLLQKMGYVPGRGLGKNAQGIISPIEAKQRKGKAAIGAYGSERTPQSLQDFPVADSEEEEEEDFRKELSQWRKDSSGLKRKPKYAYKTVEELRAKGRGGKHLSAPQQEPTQVKVIDMTGREQKVYYSYSQIGQKKHNVPDESAPTSASAPGKDPKFSFSLPELEHNLQLLIDLTEQEILHGDRRLREERDSVASLGREIEASRLALERQEEEIRSLGRVLALVEECERRTGSGGETEEEECLTLEGCLEVFQSRTQEMAQHRTDLALAIAFPLARKHFREWDPLKDPTFGTEVMSKWKELLENDHLLSHSAQDLASDAFHRMMWETWMPRVREVVAAWEPRECLPMVDFLDAWSPIAPLWITENILEQLIFPKLQKEVEGWNPLTDTVPIHSWLHPWLPLMGPRLEPLYPPIRSKLASALQRWHPSDASAKLILRPWKDVFTPGSWEAFIVKNIVPKLGLCLSELSISPGSAQDLSGFLWCLDWEGLVPAPSLVALLEKHFFPKWLQALCLWLNSGPNFEEVADWYLGWKAAFPETLLAHQPLKDAFGQALHVMNRAAQQGVGGYVQPGARENIAYLTQTERQKDFQYEASSSSSSSSQERRNVSSAASSAASSIVPSMSFKDLLEAKAEEHNIVFMPLIAKRHEGKQLYTFGRIVIYVERGVVFVQGEKTWVPTSLQSLIDRAK